MQGQCAIGYRRACRLLTQPPSCASIWWLSGTVVLQDDSNVCLRCYCLFVCCSSAKAKATAFGIDSNNVFEFWYVVPRLISHACGER
jgi:hypothetical protein